MRRVLLAWELGSGGGHIAPLLRLGAALKRRGFAVDLASARLAYTPAQWGAVDRVFQAPVPGPSMPGWPHDTRNEAYNFFDELRAASFDVPSMLVPHVRAWRNLIGISGADIVIGDFSPGAMLAARGCIPAAMTGTPYCTPAASKDGVVPDISESEPADPDALMKLLASTNEALSDLGDRPAATLAEAYLPEHSFAFGFSQADPYAALRREPLLPFTVESTEAEPGRGEEIQVFLPGHYKNDPVVLAALIALKRPVRIDDRELEDEPRHFYQKAGVRIDKALISTDTMAEKAALVIHHGGFATVTRALLAGVPQLALTRDREKRVNCRILEGAGIGEAMWSDKRTVATLTEAVERIAGDRAFAERAAALAPAFRRHRATGDTPEIIADRVAQMLG